MFVLDKMIFGGHSRLYVMAELSISFQSNYCVCLHLIQHDLTQVIAHESLYPPISHGPYGHRLHDVRCHKTRQIARWVQWKPRGSTLKQVVKVIRQGRIATVEGLFSYIHQVAPMSHVPSHERTLAPPGEYDWTRASFSPPNTVATNLEYSENSLNLENSLNYVQPQGKITTNKIILIIILKLFSMIEYLRKTAADWVKIIIMISGCSDPAQ